jgi:hypothetical protein
MERNPVPGRTLPQSRGYIIYFKYLYYTERSYSGKNRVTCCSVILRFHSISVQEVTHFLLKQKTVGSYHGCGHCFLGYQNTSSEINCRSGIQEIARHLSKLKSNHNVETRLPLVLKHSSRLTPYSLKIHFNIIIPSARDISSVPSLYVLLRALSYST